MVTIDIPKRSLAMIITTSFPGYDIKISEATACPNVKKPYTPGTRNKWSDYQLSGEHIMQQNWSSRGKLTCESVNEQTKKHGEHRDDHPVKELLVLHAAINGYTGFMALSANTHTKMRMCVLKGFFFILFPSFPVLDQFSIYCASMLTNDDQNY